MFSFITIIHTDQFKEIHLVIDVFKFVIIRSENPMQNVLTKTSKSLYIDFSRKFHFNNIRLDFSHIFLCFIGTHPLARLQSFLLIVEIQQKNTQSFILIQNVCIAYSPRAIRYLLKLFNYMWKKENEKQLTSVNLKFSATAYVYIKSVMSKSDFYELDQTFRLDLFILLPSHVSTCSSTKMFHKRKEMFKFFLRYAKNYICLNQFKQ